METPRRVLVVGITAAAVLVATSAPVTSRESPASPAADLVGLIEAQGISGFETDVRSAVMARLPSWVQPQVDEIGNLVVTIGSGLPHRLVVSTLDEDGYFVSRITDEGYLRLNRVTRGATYRLFDQFHYGQPVIIRTATGVMVKGVTGSASAHLRPPDTGIKGLEDLWVDLGARSRADVEGLGIELLNPVSLRERVQTLAGVQVAGVAAGSRAGALALVNLLRQIPENPRVQGTLTLAWATQSVFGERGFARLAQAVKADQVVVITRPALPQEPDAHGALGRLGGGPLVQEAATETIAKARAASIPVQIVTTLPIPEVWAASQTTALGLPVLFAQSPVETVNLGDVGALTRVIALAAGIRDVAEAPAEAPVGPAPSSSQPSSVRQPEAFAILRPLIEAYGVSGHEAPVRDALLPLLPQWAKPEVDSKGNVTVTFGRGNVSMVFVAHLDEIGYELDEIQDDGTATVQSRGGAQSVLYEGHPVLVSTSHGPVHAVIPPRPEYLRAKDSRPRTEDLSVYFGTSSRQQTQALGVQPGDPTTVIKRFEPLTGNRATARSIDDRVGMTALVMALARIDPATITRRVTFAWVVEEEVGLNGSQALAARSRPTYAFAVDTFVSSDSPLDTPRMAHVPLGSGAVIRGIDNGTISPPEMVAKVAALARARGLGFSINATGGSTDAGSFSRYGTIPLMLSWPGRYSHSPVEVMDAYDLEVLTNLIVALVESF